MFAPLDGDPERERERLLMMLVEVSVSHKHISLPSITHNMFSSKLGVSKGSYFLIKSAFLELAKLPSSSPFIVMPTLPHLAGESAHTHTHSNTHSRPPSPIQLPWRGLRRGSSPCVLLSCCSRRFPAAHLICLCQSEQGWCSVLPDTSSYS